MKLLGENVVTSFAAADFEPGSAFEAGSRSELEARRLGLVALGRG